MLPLYICRLNLVLAICENQSPKNTTRSRSDFCSDFRLRGVPPQTCGRGHSEGRKQILTLSIVKLFPIAYHYYNTNF